VKVRMRATESVPELIRTINLVEADFKTRYPQIRWSFFEPDDKD
jgi:hypothetical protein